MALRNLDLYAVSSNLFSFKNNKFLAEASDLGYHALRYVSDDACDVGFAICSEKTGNIATFVQTTTLRDAECEIKGWNFVCVTPGLKHLTATIFND